MSGWAGTARHIALGTAAVFALAALPACDNDEPARLTITSIVQFRDARPAPRAVELQRSADAPKRYLLRSGQGGQIVVYFTSFDPGAPCTLDFDGPTSLPMQNSSEGGVHRMVTKPIPALAPGRVIKGSLTCGEKTALEVPESDQFTAVTQAAPSIDISPTRVSFGPIAQGATSPAKPVTLTNAGDAPTVVRDFRFVLPEVDSSVSPYYLTKDGCRGRPLKPGASCVITIVLTGRDTTWAGNAEAVMTVVADNTWDNESLTLQGDITSAQKPQLVVSTTTLQFDDVTLGGYQDKEFTATNGGGGTLHITDSGFSNARSFSIVRNGCYKAALPAGGSCSWLVRFAPSAAGARQEAMFIEHDGVGPTVIIMNGTGLDAPIVTPQDPNQPHG